MKQITTDLRLDMVSLQAPIMMSTALLIVMGAALVVLFDRRYRARLLLKAPVSLTGAAKLPLPRHKTVRISRIPNTINHDQMQTWLDSLNTSNVLQDTNTVIHISMAPESSEFSQVTATFLYLPSIFQDLGKETVERDGPGNSRLAFDAHFLGMTVLYDPSQADAGPPTAE